jgi:hypothetical protein
MGCQIEQVVPEPSIRRRLFPKPLDSRYFAEPLRRYSETPENEDVSISFPVPMGTFYPAFMRIMLKNESRSLTIKI